MPFHKINGYWNTLKKAAALFSDSNALKLSASLSYYTFFSIAPFLIVVISLSGLLYGREAVEGKINAQISGLVGDDAAQQIQHIIINIQKNHHTIAGSIIGFVILLIGASSVFSEIQGSINFMWEIKNKPKKTGWLKLVVDRLWTFSLLGSIAFILLVSLSVSALLDLLSENLRAYFSSYIIYIFYGLNIIFVYLVIAVLFAVIFRVLPDVRIKWKEAITGGAFTALLFLIGKLLIGLYLGKSSLGSTYGTAASIVIIMLWVYYSSIILYFGAAFTKTFIADKHAHFLGQPETSTGEKH